MMGMSLVMSALTAKRAELAARQEQLRRELAVVEGALGHLDGTIAVFDPTFDLLAIQPARPRRTAGLPGLKPGEVGRLALDLLRTAPEPLVTQDIARAICARRNLDASPAFLDRLSRTLVGSLRHHQSRGLVVEAGRTTKLAVLWHLADQA
jgi:hypothetical protein